MRQDLGREVVVAGVNLSLDPAEISTDVDELRRAIAGSDWARAAELYGGPFLDGFYLAEGPDFERWVEEERARLAKDGHSSLESAARQSTSEGRLDLAAGHWRRLTLADRFSSRYGLGYMEALVALGDRAGALAHAQAHTELVRRELEAAPDLPITRLVEQLKRPAPEPQRSVQNRTLDRRAPSTTGPETTVQPAPLPPAVAPFGRRIRRSAPALGVAVLALAALVWVWRGRADAPPPVNPPTLAVGLIRDLASPDSARLGGVLSDMLTTDLGRLTRLEVIATSRLLELMPRGSDTTPGARSAAARRAGALEIIEGEITVTPTGQLELDLRRVALASGRVRGAYRVLAMEACPDRQRDRGARRRFPTRGASGITRRGDDPLADRLSAL